MARRAYHRRVLENEVLRMPDEPRIPWCRIPEEILRHPVRRSDAGLCFVVRLQGDLAQTELALGINER